MLELLVRNRIWILLANDDTHMTRAIWDYVAVLAKFTAIFLPDTSPQCLNKLQESRLAPTQARNMR